jgi:hypothetical protein
VSSVDFFSEDDLSALVLPSDLYTVLTATASQIEPVPGELVDAVDISFTVTGRPGVFTVDLPIVGFRVFEDLLDLTSEAGIVQALYAL